MTRIGNWQTMADEEEAAFNVQCESFRVNLRQLQLLDADFVQRFNEFVSQNPRAFEWRDEYGQMLLKILYNYLSSAIRSWPLNTF